MASVKDIAFRIDKDPVLFLGCSGTELGVLTLAGMIAGLFIGFFVVLITGKWILILPTIMFGGVLTVFRGGKVMANKKEGKPEGYYARFIKSWASSHGLSSAFIKRSGYWSVRR